MSVETCEGTHESWQARSRIEPSRSFHTLRAQPAQLDGCTGMKLFKLSAIIVVIGHSLLRKGYSGGSEAE